MNTAPLQTTKYSDFTVVPKQQLDDLHPATEGAFFILLGRHGHPDDPRESVLFVDYAEDLLVDECRRRIEELWTKHRVMITHVAVKECATSAEDAHNLTHAYERALALQELRRRLNPRFRRV